LKTLFRFVLILSLPLPAMAQVPKLPEAINKILSPLQSNDEPGAAVLVLRDQQVVFEHGYGVSDLRTLHSIDGHTNFRLASMTKQFTAMAIMLLVHDGKLHYEDHLTDLFPDFPAYGKAITVRHLLNHTSGLQDYEDLMPSHAQNQPPAKLVQIHDEGVLDLLKRERTTKFIPGTKWAYSNSGYVVLGLIVNKVSSEPFGQFLRDRIFVPLQMTDTLAYEKGKNEVYSRAYGHTKTTASWQETDQSSTSATLGDGGVYSSLGDLAKWDRALRNHQLLSPAEMQPALTPVKVADGKPREPDGKSAEYGFGWFLNPYKGHARMWHYGETIGFRTAIERFPDDKLTIIVLSNRADVKAREVALQIADLCLGLETQK